MLSKKDKKSKKKEPHKRLEIGQEDLQQFLLKSLKMVTFAVLGRANQLESHGQAALTALPRTGGGSIVLTSNWSFTSAQRRTGGALRPAYIRAPSYMCNIYIYIYIYRRQ